MNKQEAIERIKNIDTLNINDKVAGQQVDMVIKNQVLDIISQIDEQQKVAVPKFIADLIEYCKRCNLDLQTTLSRLDDDRQVGDWAYDENDDLISEKVDMIARAWLDGYEIEQEKLYTVEIPNNGGILVLACINQAIKLVDGNKHSPGKFTKGSIENAGFDWAWQRAKEVE